MDQNHFFESIQHIINLHNERIHQASLRGEYYNIFEVTKLTYDEVKLHSAFIADLLNPNGKHGLGTLPLNEFIKLNKIQIDDKILPKARVATEYSIGPISKDYSHGGNIDILIKLNDTTIVIENKIYAIDQRKQLLRYHNFIKYHPHKLLYLTLDGHEPSKESKKDLKIDEDYTCISYAEHISKWIQKCLIAAINKPLIRETL